MWAMQCVPAVVDQRVDGYVSEELPSTSSSSPTYCSARTCYLQDADLL